MSSGAEIAALVLAGGAGSRLGGVDKGLAEFRGRTLVELALDRLRDAGISDVAISANRHRKAYSRHARVIADDPAFGTHAGPLAGIAAGLAGTDAALLLTVPVDAPAWPPALPSRLAAALEDPRSACSVASGARGREPLFALYRRGIAAAAARDALMRGVRAVHAFQDAIGCVEVRGDWPADAFVNLNEPRDFG